MTAINLTAIETFEFTVNPVVGCQRLCKNPRGKIYCYAYYQAKRQKCEKCSTFEPHTHFERLADVSERTKPAMIFICSMADLFGPWVPSSWILNVLDSARDNSHHLFFFLTKYPSRYLEFDFPGNCFLGATVTGSGNDDGKIDGLIECGGSYRFLSIEPVYGPIHHSFQGIDWVIVGTETGRYARSYRREWVECIIDARKLEDDARFALFLKNNLEWPERIQEFPLPDHPAVKNLLARKESEKRAASRKPVATLTSFFGGT